MTHLIHANLPALPASLASCALSADSVPTMSGKTGAKTTNVKFLRLSYRGYGPIEFNGWEDFADNLVSRASGVGRVTPAVAKWFPINGPLAAKADRVKGRQKHGQNSHAQSRLQASCRGDHPVFHRRCCRHNHRLLSVR